MFRGSIDMDTRSSAKEEKPRPESHVTQQIPQPVITSKAAS
jgi:hypothetical protein